MYSEGIATIWSPKLRLMHNNYPLFKVLTFFLHFITYNHFLFCPFIQSTTVKQNNIYTCYVPYKTRGFLLSDANTCNYLYVTRLESWHWVRKGRQKGRLLSMICRVRPWVNYSDNSFIRTRLFLVNISGLTSFPDSPISLDVAIGPHTFCPIRTSETSGLSEPGLTNHHCIYELKRISTHILGHKEIDHHTLN